MCEAHACARACALCRIVSLFEAFVLVHSFVLVQICYVCAHACMSGVHVHVRIQHVPVVCMHACSGFFSCACARARDSCENVCLSVGMWGRGDVVMYACREMES